MDQYVLVTFRTRGGNVLSKTLKTPIPSRTPDKKSASTPDLNSTTSTGDSLDFDLRRRKIGVRIFGDFAVFPDLESHL
jgi:hypothetical protein